MSYSPLLPQWIWNRHSYIKIALKVSCITLFHGEEKGKIESKQTFPCVSFFSQLPEPTFSNICYPLNIQSRHQFNTVEKSVSLHRDKIADVSFLGTLVPSGSLGSSLSLSLSLCGWCRSVYGPPKTAQLNPQIETHTLHLLRCSRPCWMCVCVCPMLHVYWCVCVWVAGWQEARKLLFLISFEAWKWHWKVLLLCDTCSTPSQVDVCAMLSLSWRFIRVMSLNKMHCSLEPKTMGLLLQLKSISACC